ncbi:MAG: hypothetical protein WC966_06415 [Bradymonadales bacterium]|jgi:hypothetical protein
MKARLFSIIFFFLMLMPAHIFAQSPIPVQDPSSVFAQDSAVQQASAPSPYEDDSLKPREIYNLALEAFERSDFALAGEGFLKARDLAANDNELRFNAAYNLALSLAKEVDAMGDPQSADEEALNTMIEKLRLSAAWLRDALRQRPNDEDAKVNFELVLRRAQATSDILNSKYNTLERQLEALIQEQRTIRENTRLLSNNIQEQASEKEPLQFSAEFNNLANSQRFSLTQANLLADIVFDQLSVLEAKTEEQLSQEEQTRKFQLNEVSPLLEQARQRMAQARSRMRELSIEDGLRLTTAALHQLKRAREALQNPVQTLQNLIHDQAELLRLSQVRANLKDIKNTPKGEEGLKLPDWLNPKLLSDTQVDLLERTNRIDAFFSAMSKAELNEEESQNEAILKQRQQLSQALPYVQAAASAMQKATISLPNDDLKEALVDEETALDQLTEAAERFTDLRHLIELIYAQQTTMRDIIPTVPTDNAQADAPVFSFENLQKMLSFGSQKNIGRLERLSDMIAMQAAKALEATQNQEEVDAEQAKEQQALYEHAERLRALAQRQNAELKQMVDATSPPELKPSTIIPLNPALMQYAQLIQSVESWHAPAEYAQKTVEELRMLFFSVIEHIKELARQQEKTLDSTADAAEKAPALVAKNDEAAINNLLQPLSEREAQHETMAEALAQVLAQQADEMQNQSQNQQQAIEMSQRYAQASGELQASAAAMRQVKTDLGQQLFTESMQGQKTALEHLMKAIELLQPPQKQEQKQEQEQQQEQQKDKQMSKQQAENKLQQIREREKQRKNREKRPAAAASGVDKDW